MTEAQNSTIPKVTHKIIVSVEKWLRVVKLINIHPCFHLASKQLYHQKAEHCQLCLCHWHLLILLPRHELISTTDKKKKNPTLPGLVLSRAMGWPPNYIYPHQTGPNKRDHNHYSFLKVLGVPKLLSYLSFFLFLSWMQSREKSCISIYSLKKISFLLSHIILNCITWFLICMFIFLSHWNINSKKAWCMFYAPLCLQHLSKCLAYSCRLNEGIKVEMFVLLEE